MKISTILGIGLDGNHSKYLEIIQPGEPYLIRSRDFKVNHDKKLSAIVINTHEDAPIASSLFVKTLLEAGNEQVKQWYNDWDFIEKEKKDLEERTMIHLPFIGNIVTSMRDYITIRYLRSKNKEPLGNWNDAILKAQKIQRKYRENDGMFLGTINSYNNKEGQPIEIIAKEFKARLNKAYDKI